MHTVHLCDPYKAEAAVCKVQSLLPSRAAVERLFSTGKDVLRPKRPGLSDEFNMLVLLKGNFNK